MNALYVTCINMIFSLMFVITEYKLTKNVVLGGWGDCETGYDEIWWNKMKDQEIIDINKTRENRVNDFEKKLVSFIQTIETILST